MRPAKSKLFVQPVQEERVFKGLVLTDSLEKMETGVIKYSGSSVLSPGEKIKYPLYDYLEHEGMKILDVRDVVMADDRPVCDWIFVCPEKLSEDEIVFDSGVVLYKDTSYEREWSARIYADVVAIPRFLHTTIEPEVQVGDRAYFHYGSFIEDENLYFIKCVDRVKNIWRVDYENVFCVVREGKIIPIGGWVLVEPYEKEESHDFLIIPEMARRGKEKVKGRLAFIGSPRKDMPLLPLKEGDEVHFEKNCCFENDIEGKTYYVMQQQDLLLKTTEKPKLVP